MKKIRLILCFLLVSSFLGCLSYDSGSSDDDIASDNNTNIDNSVSGDGSSGSLNRCAEEFVWKPECSDGNLCILFPSICPNFEKVCVFPVAQEESSGEEDSSDEGDTVDPNCDGVDDNGNQVTPTAPCRLAKVIDTDGAECGNLVSEENGVTKWSFSNPGGEYDGRIVGDTGSAQFEFVVANPG